MKRGTKRLSLLALVAFSTAAPVGYSAERGFHEPTLECQDGTCCPEAGSTCVVGDHKRPDKYYKTSGSCLVNQDLTRHFASHPSVASEEVFPMNGRKPRIWMVMLGALAGASPISFSSSAGFVVAEACADGTCCPETGSDCFINGILTENAYKLSRLGPCKAQT